MPRFSFSSAIAFSASAVQRRSAVRPLRLDPGAARQEALQFRRDVAGFEALIEYRNRQSCQLVESSPGRWQKPNVFGIYQRTVAGDYHELLPKVDRRRPVLGAYCRCSCRRRSRSAALAPRSGAIIDMTSLPRPPGRWPSQTRRLAALTRM